MIYFLIGLAILFIGGYFYGKYCERVFEPDDRPTPAITEADGVDFVEMSPNKNKLIQLLNIAGTGPILGPIQGILFGPIAFITIPIGCVLAGALHDYFIGMISIRNKGAQVPRLVTKYLGSNTNKVYVIVISILLLLTGVVFIYTPGDLIVNDLLGLDINSNVIWIIYGAILLYYIIATLFPIDKIIGKVYPIFGATLIISALGIFVGILLDGGADLHSMTGGFLMEHPEGQPFIPVFFITVACGILSGFHGSQTTLIARTVGSEHHGRKVFFNMMIVEGFIAMCWAAGAMVVFNRGVPLDTDATLMVGEISREFMGTIGSYIAIISVIVLPITSGDTSFRSLRLTIAEELNIDQTKAKNRILLTLVLFIPAVALLYFAKSNANGFNMLWRYFGFANQFVAVFALALITSYLKIHRKNYWISLLPTFFYTFIVSSYISSASIGFGLPLEIAYLIGGVMVILVYAYIMKVSQDRGIELQADMQ